MKDLATILFILSLFAGNILLGLSILMVSLSLLFAENGTGVEDDRT